MAFDVRPPCSQAMLHANQAAQQPFRSAPYVPLVRGVGADGRNSQELLESLQENRLVLAGIANGLFDGSLCVLCHQVLLVESPRAFGISGVQTEREYSTLTHCRQDLAILGCAVSDDRGSW